MLIKITLASLSMFLNNSMNYASNFYFPEQAIEKARNEARGEALQELEEAKKAAGSMKFSH